MGKQSHSRNIAPARTTPASKVRQLAAARATSGGRGQRTGAEVERARLFAARLRALRQQATYAAGSDRAFAEAVGLKYETARQWLTHTRREPPTPGGEILAAIAARTGVSLDWLLGLRGRNDAPELRDIATGDRTEPGTVADLERALATYVEFAARQTAEAAGIVPASGTLQAMLRVWETDGTLILRAAVQRETAALLAYAEREQVRSTFTTALLQALRTSTSAVASGGMDTRDPDEARAAEAAWRHVEASLPALQPAAVSYRVVQPGAPPHAAERVAARAGRLDRTRHAPSR